MEDDGDGKVLADYATASAGPVQSRLDEVLAENAKLREEVPFL